MTPLKLAIQSAARAHAFAVLRHFLPAGRRHPTYALQYFLPSPRRQRGSLIVNILSFVWRDYGAGVGGGDVVGLVAYVAGKGEREAADELAGFLGLGPPPSALQPELPGADDEATRLLTDIRAYFASKGASRVTGAELTEALVALPGRPWCAYNGSGHPLTKHQLARRLRRCGVVAKTVRIGARRARGYELGQFANASPVTS